MNGPPPAEFTERFPARFKVRFRWVMIDSHFFIFPIKPIGKRPDSDLQGDPTVAALAVVGWLG